MGMNYDDIVRRCDQYYKQTKEAHEQLEVFYRGQARDWELKSKLQREIEDGEKEAKQKINVSDFILQNASWDKERSVFENIAHMQHYGKPTRFLDFTKSMDVALYFACESEKQEDGVIYCCSYPGRNCEFYEVELMMEIAQLTQPIQVDEFVKLFLGKNPYIRDLLGYGDLDLRERLGLRILSWADHGFMIVPTDEEAEKLKEWNPRMYSQKGVFFVQGNKIQGDDTRPMTRNISRVIITNELSEIPSTISTSRHIDKIVIPYQDKEELLKVLHSKGVNKKSLYLE